MSLGETPSVAVDAPENQQKPATTKVYEKVTRKFAPIAEIQSPTVGAVPSGGRGSTITAPSPLSTTEGLKVSLSPSTIFTHPSSLVEETIERSSEASTGSSWEQKLDRALAAAKRASILTWSGVVLILVAGFALYRGWPLPAAFFAGAGGMVIYDQNWLWLLLIVGAIVVVYAWTKGKFDRDEKAGTDQTGS